MRVLAAVLLIAGCGAEVDTPAVESFTVSISASEARTCLIVADGSLFCWGMKFEPPYTRLDPAPTRFGGEHWRSVAVGTGHACAIRSDGTLWCWGRNCAGELGDGTRDTHEEPIQFGSASNWMQVATGGGHSCAIDDTGALSCWGGPDYGQDDCAMTPMQPPMPVDGTWKTVSSHFYSIHAIRADGTLWRMADADHTATDVFGELQQVGSSTWRFIATGIHEMDFCGSRSDGTLACGDAVETQVGADADWDGRIDSRDHACAIKRDGTLWCWGRNDMGQIGISDMAPGIPLPTQVGSDSGWTDVAVGWAYSCGLRDDQVYCWGKNRQGELGLGAPDDLVHAPAPIAM